MKNSFEIIYPFVWRYNKKHYLCTVFKAWWIRLAARTHASHACNTGSIPVSTTNHALLAQLVEQLTLNQWVQGSNP